MPSLGKSRNQESPPGGGIAVVAADADEGEIVARVLEAAGHEVRRAFDVAADPMVGITTDLPALALLDLGAGAANPNLRLLRDVRDHPNPTVKNLRVVVIGAAPGTDADVWGAGADGLLHRPVRNEDLARVVAEALERPDADRAGYRGQARSAAIGTS